jgi:fructose-bisphosphate aldolase class II
MTKMQPGIVSPIDLLHSMPDGTALCAFNIETFDTLRALFDAAAEVDAPVMIAVTEPAMESFGLRTCRPLCELYARDYGVSAALHLDHGSDQSLMLQAIDEGFTSICIDLPGASAAELGELTTRLKDHGGASVETVIGALAYSNAGDEGEPTHDPRAIADDVLHFDREYAPDLLAFDLGSRHGMGTRELSLDHDLLEDVVSRTQTPVVLHGSSGVLLEEVEWAVSRGVRKVNIETLLRRAVMGAVEDFMANDPNRSKPRCLARRMHETTVPIYTELLQRLSTSSADELRQAAR